VSARTCARYWTAAPSPTTSSSVSPSWPPTLPCTVTPGRIGAQFTVRAEIHHGDYAWIEVEDNGGTWTDPVPDPSRGHGLDIIRALAADWGIDGDYRTRTVWARIDWPEHGAQPVDNGAETEAMPK
jgi:hypothetical protein